MVASVSAKMMRMVADATRRTNSERVLMAARRVCDNQARDGYLSKACEASCVRARPAPRLRWDRGRCRQGKDVRAARLATSCGRDAKQDRREGDIPSPRATLLVLRSTLCDYVCPVPADRL